METQPSIPEDVTDLPWITNGVSGAIFAVSESAIIKIPLPLENCKEQLAIERKIYERLGPHPYITKLLYTHKGTIVLERLQYPLRRRLLDIREQKQLPVAQDMARWGWQTTQALPHIRSRGVMQVDIGPHNILLDWDGNARLSDFVGSSLDGFEPMVFPSAHSEHPDIPTANPSIQSELFAPGSTLYEIETTYKPYPDKNDGELAKLFKANKFPDTRELIPGKVITKCWMAGYKDASEAVVDILHTQDRLNDLILSDKLQMFLIL
ncbi:kinase-like domain-containing protein [Calycina marina]|uniref:Kinase-like domain-containing protein n=1 Tax=Calycina marina TaxID=1763456 RepID=A0A9P8CBU2_9HELO|nr:kinase-like domain-containing protein [Calycina marina]